MISTLGELHMGPRIQENLCRLLQLKHTLMIFDAHLRSGAISKIQTELLATEVFSKWCHTLPSKSFPLSSQA
jgi:hypothetical protein